MSNFKQFLFSCLFLLLAGCSVQREIIANYCLNWDSIEQNPFCHGTIPLTIEEAVAKVQQNQTSLCYGECSFSTPSQIRTVLQITVQALKVINYLEANSYSGASTDFPAVMDFTEQSVPEQQVIITDLTSQAATDGLCTSMVIGPTVVEVAEVAAIQPCFVLGVQRPDDQNYTNASEYYRTSEAVDTYHGVTDTAGMGTMFTTGVEELPSGVMVDNIIMQHPKPNTVEHLCMNAISHLSPDGTFTIVPDQDYIHNSYGFMQPKTGTERLVETLASCLASEPSMSFVMNVYEHTTPEAVRQITGYNISNQWFGKDFSYFALPDGTPMTIVVIRREE